MYLAILKFKRIHLFPPLESSISSYVISSQYLFIGLTTTLPHSTSKPTLSMWIEPFQHMWVPLMPSNQFHLWSNNDLILYTIWLLVAQLVPWHNASTYSLLCHSHGPSAPKPSLALHPCLVLQRPFLAIFTLSSHPHVTSYLEINSNSLKIYLFGSHILTPMHHNDIIKLIHNYLYSLHFGLIHTSQSTYLNFFSKLYTIWDQSICIVTLQVFASI